MTLATNEPEVIKNILSFLHGSKENLCIACRVHRALREPASSLLYHTITIRTFQEIEYLYTRNEDQKDVRW